MERGCDQRAVLRTLAVFWGALMKPLVAAMLAGRSATIRVMRFRNRRGAASAIAGVLAVGIVAGLHLNAATAGVVR